MGLRDPTVYDRGHVADKVARRSRTAQFQRLPGEAQDELRARWQAEVQRQIDREDVRLEMQCATVITCALLFLFVTCVWDVPTSVTVPAALVVGVVTGIVWNVLDAGRFLALLTVMPGYLLLRVLGPSQNVFAMFFGAVAMAAFATLCGVRRETRSGDARPTGLAPHLRRLLRRDCAASRLLADRGIARAVPTDAQPGIGPWGPAAQQGGDGDRPASWTDRDLGAGDEES